jgi:hypothetical protein
VARLIGGERGAAREAKGEGHDGEDEQAAGWSGQGGSCCSLSACALIEILPDRREQPWAMAGLGVGMRWEVLGWRLGDDACDLVGLGVGG